MHTKANDYPNPEAWRLSGLSFQPLFGGARNKIFRATAHGLDVVFKSTRRTEAQLRWLAYVRTAADRVGLRVSLPVETGDGRLSHGGWVMEQFIEGRPATPADLQALTPVIKAFHKAALGSPQRPGFASAQDLITGSTGGDIDLTVMPQDIVSQCRIAWNLVPEKPTSLIHADLNAGNLLIGTDGAPILLDWDEARVDSTGFDLRALGYKSDPVMKAAALAFEIAICWCIEPERAQSLCRDLPNAVQAAQNMNMTRPG